MSLTPGWLPKEFKAYTPGVPVTFNITEKEDGPDEGYYLDNGQEYKRFPRTKAGWQALMDTLKEMVW